MIKSTFSHPAFVLACKKIGYIFYSSMTRLVTPIFDHGHPIHFWSAFNCYESAWTWQKSVFHLFILQIELILETHHMTGHMHFWHQPLNFQRSFNLHEFVPACKRSVNSWDTVNLRAQRSDLLNLLWRNS